MRKAKFNKGAQQGWRVAADAARNTDQSAGSEGCKCTLGGEVVAMDNSFGVVR